MHLSTNFGKEIREKKSPGTNGLMVCSQPTKHETSNTIFVISTNLQYLLAESSGSKNFPLSLFPQHGITLERSDFNLIEQPFTLHLKTISLSASRKDDLQIHPTLHACSLCSRLNVLYSSPTTYFGTRVSPVNLYVSLYCSLCLNASEPAKPTPRPFCPSPPPPPAPTYIVPFFAALSTQPQYVQYPGSRTKTEATSPLQRAPLFRVTLSFFSQFIHRQYTLLGGITIIKHLTQGWPQITTLAPYYLHKLPAIGMASDNHTGPLFPPYTFNPLI